jgi:O-antigen/teichoic acid export membrane protein
MTMAAAPSRGVVARGVSWIGTGHVIRQLAWYASLLFVATLVSPRDFGTVTAAMVVVQAAWLVVNSGTRGAIVVTRTLTVEQVRRAVGMNLATGTAIACAANLLSTSVLPVVIPGADPLVLQVLATTIMLNSLSIVPLALLQRDLRFRQHASANAVAAVGASGLCVAAALAGAGVWALVIRQVLFQLFLAGLAWRSARPLLSELPRIPGSARRDPVGKWFFATTTIVFVALNADNVIVGHVGGVRVLGLYSLAFTMAFAPVTQIAAQIGTVLQAAAARTESVELLGQRVRKAVRATALVLLPAAVPAIALAPVALPALLGSEWQAMVTPFQLLVIAGVAQAAIATIRQFLVSCGGARFCAGVEASCLVATVAALFVLVRLYGIVGAGIAHLMIAGLMLVAYGVRGVRRIGSSGSALWASVRGIVVAVAAQGFVTALSLHALEGVGTGPGMAAFVAAVVGIAALAGALAVGGVHPIAEFRSLLGKPGPRRHSRMRAAYRRRPRRLPPIATQFAGVAVAASAVLAGAIAVAKPGMTAGLVVMALAIGFAFRAPVAHLLLLIALTAIVPQSIEARFGSGGSASAAGVLPTDCLLIAALFRGVVVLPWQPLPRRARCAVALTAAFLLGVCVQVWHAVSLGRPLSGVGGESRVLLAIGTLLAAVPLVANPSSRRRLLAGLPLVGFAVGCWGVVQFALGLRFAAPDSYSSVASYLTAGRVVGLLVFPVAAIVSLAVVTGAPPRGVAARMLLLATFVVNTLAVVLSFERTVLLVTVGGCVLVFVRGTAAQRLRIVAWAPPVLAVGVAAVALASPAVLPAYAQRLSSLTSLQTDQSAIYRAQESQVVGREIAAHPFIGSAPGASILIGRPGTNQPLVLRRHAENGYQWLAWKLGIPTTVLLVAILALAIFVRGGQWETEDHAVLRRACQCALVALAVVTVTFPSVEDFEVTPIIGVIAALALSRPLRPEWSR